MSTGLLYTKYCVVCKDKTRPIVSVGGHVVRRDTYTKDSRYEDIHVIASKCEEHKDVRGSIDGYYGEYTADMGICDYPFQAEEKGPVGVPFEKIPVGHVARFITKDNNNDDQEWLRMSGGGCSLSNGLFKFENLEWFRTDWLWEDMGPFDEYYVREGWQ